MFSGFSLQPAYFVDHVLYSFSARLCAQAGLTVLERCKNQVFLSRCYLYAYVYTLHWTTPVKDLLKPLLKGYRIGMTTGTLYGGFYCAAFYVEFCLWTGVELTSLYTDCTTYLRQMEDYEALKHAAFLNTTRHMIARLVGYTNGSEEEDFEALFQEKNDIPMMCALRRAQIYVGCYLGEHQKVADFCLEWQPIIAEALISQVSILEITFASSLSCMALARQRKGRVPRKYINMAAKCRKKIKAYLAKSCPNCVARMLNMPFVSSEPDTDEALLDAEWSVLKTKKGNFKKKYEQAVLLAGRRGLTHLQALANERLAIYMEETRDDAESMYRYEQALNLYAEWEAKAKVDQLQIKIGAFKEKDTTISSHFKGQQGQNQCFRIDGFVVSS
eukprot:scaffold220_cov169-Amphora_coffeaeformis.AAC.31